MLTNLAFEGIAEGYCSEFSERDLKHLIDDNGVDSEELRSWLESEYPEEQFDDEDISDFNSCIIKHAEYLITEAKQEAASELRSTVESAIDDYCSILEDYEIASVLADYVARYLSTELY